MSYYSSEGVTIHQGAAGLGEYFVKLGEVEQARAGGGGVHAFRQGILSGLGVTMRYGAKTGPSSPYRSYGGPVRHRDTPRFHGMGEYFETGDAQPGSFDDGVFLADEQQLDGQFQAWRNGSLGADAPVVKLDLANKDTLQQYKKMLGFALGRQDLPLDDPTWDVVTEGAYRSLAATPSSPAANYKLIDGHAVPTAAGTQLVLAGLMANPVATPAWIASNLPKISAWIMAGGTGEVKAPLLPGQKALLGMKMSTVAMVGFGAAVATGAYFIFRKKKMTSNRRRKAA